MNPILIILLLFFSSSSVYAANFGEASASCSAVKANYTCTNPPVGQQCVAYSCVDDLPNHRVKLTFSNPNTGINGLSQAFAYTETPCPPPGTLNTTTHECVPPAPPQPSCNSKNQDYNVRTATCEPIPDCNKDSYSGGLFYNTVADECQQGTGELMFCVGGKDSGDAPISKFCPPLNDCVKTGQVCSNKPDVIAAHEASQAADKAAAVAAANAAKDKANENKGSAQASAAAKEAAKQQAIAAAQAAQAAAAAAAQAAVQNQTPTATQNAQTAAQAAAQAAQNVAQIASQTGAASEAAIGAADAATRAANAASEAAAAGRSGLAQSFADLAKFFAAATSKFLDDALAGMKQYSMPPYGITINGGQGYDANGDPTGYIGDGTAGNGNGGSGSGGSGTGGTGTGTGEGSSCPGCATETTLQKVIAGTGRGKITKTAGTFDDQIPQQALDDAKAELTAQMNAIKADMATRFSFNTSSAAALPVIHLMNYKGQDITADLNRFATYFDIMAYVLMFLAAFFAIQTIFGD